MQNKPTNITIGWKNKEGSGKDKPKCGCASWKEHWEKNSNTPWPKKCSIKDCNNAADDGAHVYNQMFLNFDDTYIIPMCDSHNHPSNTDTFGIKYDIIPVLSTPLESCKYENKPKFKLPKFKDF